MKHVIVGTAGHIDHGKSALVEALTGTDPDRWEEEKRRGITIDLGFVVSNDGLNFREPAHEWTFLKRGEDGTWDQGGLLQGQGFENIGDQTFVYYGAWDPRKTGSSPRGGVGIGTLPRDRFAEERLLGRLIDRSGQGLPEPRAVLARERLVLAYDVVSNR